MKDKPTWTDIAIVILTGGIVFFALMQWLEMRGAGKQTEQLVAYARSQADAASDQADAAQQFSDTAEDINGSMSIAVDQLTAAATNAKASIRATQDAVRLDQRAWVVWKGIEGVPTLTQPWTLNVYFGNTGKTPAKNVRVFCHANPVTSESELVFDKAVPESKPTIIAPNDTNTYCSLTPMKIPTVTQDVLNIFSSKEKILFAHGSVVYDDIFGKKHWLTFCRSMHPDGKAWDACDTHNDTGDGEQPKPKAPTP